MTSTSDYLVNLQLASGKVAKFACRPDTNDAALVYGIIAGQEYPFDRLQGLSGWAIDIGAHIGIVTVALALDNPDLRIVAVEALPENVTMLRANVALNGLTDRVRVESAAAGSESEADSGSIIPIVYGWAYADNQPDDYMRQSQFIGGMVGANDSSRVAQCPAVSLRSLCQKHGIAKVRLLKIDAEGAEWYFCTSPYMTSVEYIVGELHHGKNGGAAEFRAILRDFDVIMDDAKNVAVFEAWNRSDSKRPAPKDWTRA